MSDVQVGSSNSIVKLEFVDVDGAERVPTSVSYQALGREEEDDSWTEIVALTPMAGMAATMTLAISSPITTFLGSGPKELRKICFYVDSAFYKSVLFNLTSSDCS